MCEHHQARIERAGQFVCALIVSSQVVSCSPGSVYVCPGMRAEHVWSGREVQNVLIT